MRKWKHADQKIGNRANEREIERERRQQLSGKLPELPDAESLQQKSLGPEFALQIALGRDLDPVIQ